MLLQLLADQPHHLHHPDLKGTPLDALGLLGLWEPVLAIAKHLVEQNVARKKEGPKAIAPPSLSSWRIAIQLQEIDGFSEGQIGSV